MSSDRVEAVAALLVRAEAAHGEYEATELNGVYDAAWPEWYATWAVEHGLGELIGHEVTADRVAAALADGYAAFGAMEPDHGIAWSDFLARRLVAEL